MSCILEMIEGTAFKMHVNSRMEILHGEKQGSACQVNLDFEFPSLWYEANIRGEYHCLAKTAKYYCCGV